MANGLQYHIPYNPQADPNTYAAQGFQNLLSGLLQSGQWQNLLQGLQQSGLFPQTGGINLQPLMGVRDPQMRQMAMALLGEQMMNPLQQAQAGLYGAETEKTRAEIPFVGKGTREQFTLGPGQTRFTAEGQPIVQGAPEPITPYQKAQMKKIEAEMRKIEAETINLGREPKEAMLTKATKLRDEYKSSPIYKNYLIVQDSAMKMQAAYNESVINPSTKSRVASDQALAVLFQKMLDPTSVVRESEYARTPEGIAAMNWLSAWLPKLKKGGLQITDEDRKALYNMAEKLLDVSKQTMNRHTAEYAGFAQKYGVDSSLILGNAKQFNTGQIMQIKDPTGQEALALPIGTQFIDPNGVLRTR